MKRAEMELAIDYHALKGRELPEVVRDYGANECILYALGLGIGQDPVDPHQLRFVYEKDLLVMPTLPTVIAHPGFWYQDPSVGIDWRHVVHGEQYLTIHRTMPASGRVRSTSRVVEIIDKGEGKGAHVYWERELFDEIDGALLSTLSVTAVCRSAGGFGGPAVAPPHSLEVLPDTDSRAHFDFRIPEQAALIYRLSGDMNPLHADPASARASGFGQPILHGLATYGAAAYSVLAMISAEDPSRLRRFDARFSAPVYPGDLLRTELWEQADGLFRFRTSVPDRGVVVLDRGTAEMHTTH